MGKKTESLAYFLAGFICGLVSYVTSYLIGNEGYLAVNIAKILFPTIIQVNATLIGFWGIVFIYYLKILNDRYNNIFNHSMHLVDKCEELLTKNESSNDEKVIASTKEKINRWINRSKVCDEVNDAIFSTISGFSILGIIVVICFLASIIVSIISLGKITDSGIETFWIQVSLFPFMLGVGLSFIGIWASTPKTNKTSEIEEIKNKVTN